LAGADAIVAVSSTIGRDLAARSAMLAATRLEIIPNPVDVAGIRNAVAGTRPPLDGPYAIFVGKLEINKGSAYLIPAIQKAQLPWPLVVVGDGAERARIDADARRAGRDVRMVGWAPRNEALAWLAHASLLVFPSYGPESLSRVLLEAAALGVPIAAMDTGGTGDIVKHEVTGLLATSADGLGDHVARLVNDRVLAASLAEHARLHVDQQFDAPRVIQRIEALYADVVRRRKDTHA
jgi:glycosyltransferase involved in cell wall biosynthesis